MTQHILKTTQCLECGADTDKYGYVNRIPADRKEVFGYICGGCVDAGYGDCPKEEECPAWLYDDDCECQEWDEELFDEYWKEHILIVDSMFPDAKAFREFMESD